jgi:flagellar biosynthesis/type III secretory pathway protein FliH
MMRLAPLYQEEKAKARQEGFEQGIREGEARGEARGIREGEARGEARGKINLILRLLNRKFGNLNPNSTEQIGQLSLDKLETLGESLLDFNTQADLDNWLRDNLSS